METEKTNNGRSKRRGAKFTCSDMLSVVTEMCKRRTKRSGLVKHYLKFGDKGLLNLGPLTTDISWTVGIDNNKCRRLLTSLEKKGVILADRSPGCTTRWWTVGLAKELACR